MTWCTWKRGRVTLCISKYGTARALSQVDHRQPLETKHLRHFCVHTAMR